MPRACRCRAQRLPWRCRIPTAAASYASIERQLRATRRLLRSAASTPRLSAAAAREAVALVTHIVTTAWELSAKAEQLRDSSRNRVRLAYKAETWMREHLADTVRIPDVCLALRVSRRELEYAFRSTFDQSPRDFLHALRLNAIRRALRRTDSPLTRIAFDHGVTHLGRFAAQYHGLFGEKPSETARGRR